MIVLLLCCESGSSKTAVGPSWSYWSGQMLPAVYGASIPRRDDGIERTRDPADESCEHCSVTESDGNQRPAVI